MGAVDQHLVAGVGVDRGHQALLDAEGVVEHLDHRHEAVRRARGVGDDLVRRGVERVVVDADHEGGVGAGGRGRDDHEGRAGVEVGGRLVAVGEEAGRLDDDVDAEVAPRQLRRVALGEDLERVAVDRDAVVGRLDVVVEPAEHRVVLSRWAIVSTEPRSLAATKSMSAPGCLAARKKLRPMRPKPLMPTRMVMSRAPLLSWPDLMRPCDLERSPVR